jgi:serine/threonine-protein kinase
VIGAYRLDRPIGRGGMGSVWLAHVVDAKVNSAVALKVLNRALLGRAGRERFAREGRALAQLKHPHIARLLDTGLTDEGQPYLVLEHVVGVSIDEFVNQARYTPRQRIALFLDVVAAVAHAHANHIIHRDIKPTNILVRDDGVPKLLDFGIAKLLADGRDLGDPSSLSRESGYALTPRYASPEQIRGEPVSIATDVYALGVLLYLLLTGRHPTPAGRTTAAEQIRAVIDVVPMPLSEAAADSRSDELADLCRGGLDAIVARMLAKATRDRHRTLAELATDLETVLWR